MTRILFLVICLIIASSKSSTSAVIDCKFEEYDYLILGNTYRCNVDSDPNITTQESALQTTVKATHSYEKTNNDVLGFKSSDMTVHFFPQDLDICFPNLKAIWIENCGLKEISQSDLKSFPQLVNIYLPQNSIKIIDEGLFDFNLKLEFIGFGDNEIVHIDPNVFDNLSRLRYFWFENVGCINKNIDNSRAEVLTILKEVKSNCVNLEVAKKSSKPKMCSDLNNLNQYTKSATDQLELTQNTLKASQEALSASQSQISNSIGNLTENFCKFKTSQDDFMTMQYDMKASISDIESTISGHKAFQNEIKITLAKLKASQNEMKMLIDEFRIGRDCDVDKKLESENENSEKCDKVEESMAKQLHKMSINFDEKIERIENRLMKKFEERMRKVLNEVLKDAS